MGVQEPSRFLQKLEPVAHGEEEESEMQNGVDGGGLSAPAMAFPLLLRSSLLRLLLERENLRKV